MKWSPELEVLYSLIPNQFDGHAGLYNQLPHHGPSQVIMQGAGTSVDNSLHLAWSEDEPHPLGFAAQHPSGFRKFLRQITARTRAAKSDEMIGN
jgi:hypothetical protein